MLHTIVQVMGPSWLKRKPRAAKPGRVSRSRYPLALVALEERVLLSFAAPVNYNVGTQNSLDLNGFGPHVITADFNGDSKLDLAATNTADGTVNILMGNGNGTFQTAVSYNTGLGAGGPVWLAAADFNGDGKLDLAVEGSSNVSILLGNGNGTFGTAKLYPTSLQIRGGLAVGDYFGNGRQDVAVAAYNNGNGVVQILPNNGNGTFGTAISVALPSGFGPIRSIVTGNFFGNGYADLAVAGGEGYNNVLSTADPACVGLFKNDGHGNFTFQAKYLAVVTPDPSGGNGQGDTVNPEQLNVADLNGDGKPDLVESLYDHNIDVFINNGNGTFQPAVGYATETPTSVGGYPRGVAFGDFNGDGKVDIASLNFGEPVPADQSSSEPGSVGILYGNGDGTFQPAIQYTPYLLPGGVAVGDFNGDGLPDLAVAQNYTGHALGVMLNQPNTATEPPTVTSVSPATGPTTGGTQTTIIGTNFTGTSQVDFGSVPATAFTVNSDTSITATAPAEAAGTVDISVYNAGASATSAADDYTYQTVVVTDTWTGLGTTNNWSDPANWSANAVPGAGATVIFNSTSSKNAIVDSGFAGTVAALQINSGYAGTVSLNENLTVTGAFTEQAGTYNANGYATTVSGPTTVSGGTYLASTNTQTLTGGLTVSGGTFTGSTGTVTAGSVTLSSGTLNAPSAVLTVAGGNFTYTGGTFNADLGTVTYTGNSVSPTVSVGTGLIRFYNFTDALTSNGSSSSLTITGTLTVTGTFAWKNSGSSISGNIEAQGDVDDENHGGIGNPYLTLDGNANQTIEDLSGGGGGQFRTITINKTGGTVSLASNPSVFSGLTLTAGTVNTGTYSWLVGSPLSAASGLNLGNIEVESSAVTVSSANLQVANVTFVAAGDKLTAPTGNLLVSGNWTNSVGASFTPNGGTVVFDGTGGIQLLTSGGKAFNNLTILAGATLKPVDKLTVLGVFTNDGTLLTSSSAAFVSTDNTTNGNWRSAYGGDGYDIEGDSSATNPSLPSYATVSVTGNYTYTWGTNTGSPYALQNAAASGDIAATWFSPSSFNINVGINDGKAHLVTLYALDWDQLQGWNVPRSERIDVLDATTGTVLDTRTLSSFQGEYVSWNISGNVTIRVTNLVAGNNAVIGGIFFGAASASAAFVSTDNTTNGNWRSAYGGDGYDIEGDSSATNPSLPSYASVSVTGNYTYTWGTNTGSPYALQNAAASGDIAATWFSPSSFNINVGINDGKAHLVTLYALDWDQLQGWNVPRSERIDVLDATTGTVLDTRTLSSFQGEYVSWNISGNVTIRVTNLVAGNNAVIGGIFFGSATG